MFGWCFRISNEWISFPVNWIVSPVTPTVYVEPSLLKKARLAMTFFKLFINFRERKRPFSSSLLPLFQNESKCETFYMKMSFTCRFIFMLIKVIFIRMVSHLDSLWNRGTGELGIGVFMTLTLFKYLILLSIDFYDFSLRSLHSLGFPNTPNFAEILHCAFYFQLSLSVCKCVKQAFSQDSVSGHPVTNMGPHPAKAVWGHAPPPVNFENLKRFRRIFREVDKRIDRTWMLNASFSLPKT